MEARSKLRLYDPRRGDLAFSLEPVEAPAALSRPQRSNYFTIFLLREGEGKFHADLSTTRFDGPVLLFSNPYQIFYMTPEAPVRGLCLRFHANFFCIETHHEAVGCNGVLFNDIHGEPQVRLDGASLAGFEALLAPMEAEFHTRGVAHPEALVSYLKLFLIKATRLKLEQQNLEPLSMAGSASPALARLPRLIEEHYRTWHRPVDYASALHMTPKALGRLVKAHFGRTLTQLIRERLFKHAKWQLLHTRRPVKEIAWEIGFGDELYFSRVFKSVTGCSPTFFREFETAIRGGSNLSM